MSVAKISLTIVLQGNTTSRKESRKNSKSVVKQVITLTDDAYYDMISQTSKPEWFNSMSDWKKLSKEARLRSHLKRYCEYLGGIDYTYEVFPD